MVKDLFKAHFKEEQLLTEKNELQFYGKDWTNYYEINPSCIFFPEDTLQVKKAVELCNQHNIKIVPSGGRTGLSGGAVASHQELVISFERMNKILEFDPVDQLLVVESGVITQEIQRTAEENGLYFPIDFSAVGSSQIGGNIATNAGGVKVIRYGNTRQWVAGLEVVTGAGDILHLNQGLVKNATGYDLRHLLIGSEGTLGLITKAYVKLTKKPNHTQLALFACADWTSLLNIFKFLSKESSLLSVEMFTQDCLNEVISQHDVQKPFETESPYYLLIETEGEANDHYNSLIDSVFENQWAMDGILAQSSPQENLIWSYRELISESISRYKPYKNDVSVRPSKLPEFTQAIEQVMKANYPDYRVLWFGHIGDGNLHINILKPENLAMDQFVESCKKVDEILFSELRKLNGSISAEHGVGLLKREALSFSRSNHEIELMKSIKKAFDPNGILNPGKIFSVENARSDIS